MSTNPSPTPTSTPPLPPPWFVRRHDQATLAVLALVSLFALTGFWIYQRGWSGQLVDIDQQSPPSVEFLIDINTADWPEFAQLPGIGETLARRIIESRQKDGPFSRPEDLRRVRGIGVKTLEKIRPFLMVDESAGSQDLLKKQNK